MRDALALLVELHRLLPVPDGAPHALAADGDALLVYVSADGRRIVARLSARDLDRPVPELAARTAAYARAMAGS